MRKRKPPYKVMGHYRSEVPGMLMYSFGNYCGYFEIEAEAIEAAKSKLGGINQVMHVYRHYKTKQDIKLHQFEEVSA